MNITSRISLPIILLGIWWGVGCTHELLTPAVPENAVPLNIDGSIDQVSTKATAGGFVDGDALGLYAVNYENNNATAGTLKDSGNQVDNAKYVFDEKNWKWEAIKAAYYKDVNTNVDLYVYYPWRQSVSNMTAVNFEVQKDQSAASVSGGALSGYEASDFLWAKVENVVPTEEKVKVTLKHKLANAFVVLEEGTGFEPGAFEALEKHVLVTNTTRKATINYTNATVTAVGAAQIDGIVMAPQEDGSFRAIVIPQTLAAGVQLFSITVDGISYGFTSAENIAYTAGKMTKFTIKVNKKSPTGDYELVLSDTQILDWTEDRNTHGGEARQYFVVNVEEPGTLGRTIKAAKKNPDKIRNLKVTGKVTDTDFYFMRDSMAILEAVNMKESKVVHIPIGKGYTYLDDAGIYRVGRTEPYVDGVIPAYAFDQKRSLIHFVFPEYLMIIDDYAFDGSGLAGQVIFPEGLESIGFRSFHNTNVLGIQFPNTLKIIDGQCFAECKSLSGTLLFPASLKTIGSHAFYYTGNLSGPLHLPDELEELGEYAFYYAGNFVGDLIIPERIKVIDEGVFGGTSFSGHLGLNNVQELRKQAFKDSGFVGELVIPEGVREIGDYCFSYSNFSSISFPSSLKVISYRAFWSSKISGPIAFPEGLISIGEYAFDSCHMISSLDLPISLQMMGSGAFMFCFGITKIVSRATEPPTIQNSTFDGVGKDNLTVEVPEQSMIRYQTENGWSDFKRIFAWQDFSISRRLMRTLNASESKTFVLRAPSGFDWSVESKPDWVTVTPSSGTGKAEVTVTVSEMPRTQETFEQEVRVDGNYSRTDTYKGRAGEIVFLLNDKDYRSAMTVEQYDYDYADGETLTLQSATRGAGIDIVLMGEGYDAKDIASEMYKKDMSEAMGHFFGLEPYTTYQEYFNVYAVFAKSDETGVGTVNTIVDNKFGTYITQNRMKQPDVDGIFSYARKTPMKDVSKSLVILVDNTSLYEGVTFMFGDGSAIASCPKSTLAYPFDFRGIVQHEAGGHGFGKLADEYIYHNAFISACSCFDGCDHGLIFNANKSRGWYRNLDFTGDMHEVGWSHLIFHPQYSDVVDVYEGGYMHSRGVFRSEPNSCMNNNIPYYSAISRQAIVERIMDYAGEEFTLEKFYANDKNTPGAITKAQAQAEGVGKYSVPGFSLYGHEHGPVYLGEHPNVK